jgi:orotidine-5'-phosphate decarboxylase
MTPKDAINLGANFLVIGRPITEAKNIKEALLEIHNSL